MFRGAARTVAGYRLFDLGGYPGLTAVPSDRDGVIGEIWSVDTDALARLDAFEGVHEGLYRRGAIALAAPFADAVVDAYFPALSTHGRTEVGNEWIE